MRRALAPCAALLALALCASARAGEGDEAYAGLIPLAGDSHQHAATLYMIERSQKDPPVPGFPKYLHENSSPSDAYDALRTGGYDWVSLSHHDTNYPGKLANVCIDAMSEKYRWWLAHEPLKGFPDATRPGTTVDPPSNEALALSRVAAAKTVNGFLAFTGREFTNENFFPSGVGPREGGHKIVVLPGDTRGLCTVDGLLVGDEYCRDEAHLYLWALGERSRPVLIQAHPGLADQMDLRPFHPKNAPGGFTDQFVEGIEVGSEAQDPQWEQAYQRALHLGYQLFPSYGSDDHYATWPGSVRSPRLGATVCWAAARTRQAVIDALLARRCYFSGSFVPELRFSVRPHAGGAWQPMGARVDLADGLADVRIHVRNDPRNRADDPGLGKRLDSLDLVDDAGAVLATCGAGASPPTGAKACACARSADGADTCTLEVDSLRLHDGAFYPRLRMSNPAPAGCRSKDTPELLQYCNTAALGAPVFVNWDRFRARGPYRQCVLDPDHLPCGAPGCLPPAVDHDQDGWPDDCDVCPSVNDPTQPDANLDGYGDRCGRDPVLPPAALELK
ncbi:MAG TPA: hypothetical protein VMR86_20025 [Myxococcota bacterium]|nr:hypothetical protein [Myxococcota bacterium]